MSRTNTKARKTLNRILDAALSCYEESGINGTRLEDVARTAQIGRTTLYRYVKNRDDLLSQVVMRDAEEQRKEMQLINQYANSLADSILDSAVHVLRGRRNRPINKLLFGEDGDSLSRVNLSPASIYALTESLLAPQFADAVARGEIREGVTLEAAAHWLARVMLSLVTFPEEFIDDEEALRQFVRQFIIPSLIVDNAS
ncbi:MAG: TetR/AcrR family transcriptional regulator [Thiohalobacterales bacterium]|nr:TetR/AcrR family transcriptional regulator [Thiohalobacterales bacterium]